MWGGWIHRFYDRRLFTIAASGTLSDEKDLAGCYPTRVFVENTTGAPSALTFWIDDPTSATGTFIQLYSAGSALSISVTAGKWNELSSDLAKLIACKRVKVGCSSWSAGGRIYFDLST